MRSAIVLALMTGFALTASGEPQSTQLEEARSILHSASALVPMVIAQQRSSVGANIAVAQVKAGDVTGALSTLTTLAADGQSDMAIDTVASTLAVNDNLDLALKLVDSSSKANVRANSYSGMALSLALKSKFELALQMADRIPEDQYGLRIDTLMRIYGFQAKAGDSKAKAETLEKSLGIAAAAQEDASIPIAQRQGFYLTILMWLGEAGDATAAFPALQAVQALADSNDDPTQRYSLLSNMAQAEVSLGNFTAARQIIAQLPAGNSHDGAIAMLAFKLLKVGAAQEAIEASKGISLEELRLAIKRSAVETRAERGSYGGALDIIQTIAGGGERAYALSQLALDQAEHEDPAAGYTNELAWEAARENAGTNEFVFEEIAVTKAFLGDYDGSIAILENLSEEGKWWVAENLTATLVQAGRVEKAKAVAEAQTQAYAKASALLGIAQGMLANIEEQQTNSNH